MKKLVQEIKKMESEDRAKKKVPCGAMYRHLYGKSGLDLKTFNQKLRQLLDAGLITVVPTINDFRLNST